MPAQHRETALRGPPLRWCRPACYGAGRDVILPQIAMAKRLIRHPAVQGALARLVAVYLRLVWATTRWTLVGDEHARPFADQPMILAFWHERLPLAALGWRLLARCVPCLLYTSDAADDM
jgi:hypothetical protein